MKDNCKHYQCHKDKHMCEKISYFFKEHFNAMRKIDQCDEFAGIIEKIITVSNMKDDEWDKAKSVFANYRGES